MQERCIWQVPMWLQWTETIQETYVDQLTDRVKYWRWLVDDLRIVPCNLQMMMDWDSHIKVEYSGSGHCVQYINKYCYKGPTQREQIKMDLKQMYDSDDEIKLFIHRQVSCSMSAMLHFYGYQYYPASIPTICSFKVQTQQQLEFINNYGEVSVLQVYYNRPHE